jgi:hypothetical protein
MCAFNQSALQNQYVYSDFSIFHCHQLAGSSLKAGKFVICCFRGDLRHLLSLRATVPEPSKLPGEEESV